jgi:hypothetical protein
MKKIILASVLSLVLLVAFGLEAKAEPAKEGAYAFTAIYSGTLKSLAMGEERVQITYELMGVHVSDTGEGLLHNASYRGLGVIHAVKGTLEYSRGMLVFNLPDGDQAFIIYEGTGKLGGPSKFTSTFVGGTGKLAGIDGGIEWTSYGARPAAEGTMQGVVKGEVHWKLP